MPNFGTEIAAVIGQAANQIIQAHQFQQRLQLEREQFKVAQQRQAEVFKMQQERFELEKEIFQLDKSKQARLQQEADVKETRAGLELDKVAHEAYEREAARRDGSDPDFAGYSTMEDLAKYISSAESSQSAERSRTFGETVNTPAYQERQATVDRAKLEQRNRATWLKTNRPPNTIAVKSTEDELTRLSTGGGTPKAQEFNPAAPADPLALAGNVHLYKEKGDFDAVYSDLAAAARQGPDQVDALFAAYANLFPGGRDALRAAVAKKRQKAK